MDDVYEAKLAAEARCAELETRVRELEAWDKRREALLQDHEVLGVRSLMVRAEFEDRLEALTEAARQTLDCAKCGEDYGICCACTARLRAALEDGK